MVVEHEEHGAEHDVERSRAEIAAEKQQEAAETKEKFVCPKCGKEFHSEMALRGHMSAHKRSTTSRAQDVKVSVESESEDEKWIESELIPKKIALRPSILVYYEWAKRHGFEGGLSEFINRCVEDLFERVMGVQLALVERQVQSVVLSGGEG